jgi:hypothetical protein
MVVVNPYLQIEEEDRVNQMIIRVFDLIIMGK